MNSNLVWIPHKFKPSLGDTVRLYLNPPSPATDTQRLNQMRLGAFTKHYSGETRMDGGLP